MREEEGEREREGRHVVISFLVSRVYVFIYFVRSTSTERALDTLLSGGLGLLGDVGLEMVLGGIKENYSPLPESMLCIK